MKRYRTLALALTLFAPAAFVGCGEEAKTVDIKKEVTPTGSKETTSEVKEKTTGDMKPEAK